MALGRCRAPLEKVRNVVWSGSSIVMLAACLCGGVAYADDSTSLGDKIDAALAAAKSYQVNITHPDGRISSTVVVNGIGSRYTSTTSGDDALVIYALGTTVYQHTSNGWRRFLVDPNDVAAMSKPTARRRSAEPLPDRTEDGTTFGVAKTTITLALPGLDPATNAIGPGVCTYDKGTFLLHTCTFDRATLRYSHFDDPSLTIDVPAEAKDAPAFQLPSALPAAHP